MKVSVGMESPGPHEDILPPPSFRHILSPYAELVVAISSEGALGKEEIVSKEERSPGESLSELRRERGEEEEEMEGR